MNPHNLSSRKDNSEELNHLQSMFPDVQRQVLVSILKKEGSIESAINCLLERPLQDDLSNDEILALSLQSSVDENPESIQKVMEQLKQDRMIAAALNPVNDEAVAQYLYYEDLERGIKDEEESDEEDPFDVIEEKLTQFGTEVTNKWNELSSQISAKFSEKKEEKSKNEKELKNTEKEAKKPFSFPEAISQVPTGWNNLVDKMQNIFTPQNESEARLVVKQTPPENKPEATYIDYL